MGNHSRIAKNTVFLFIRMLFQMVISLYTSRLVLSFLGIDNYGIYNVVGGLVAMVSYINQALTSSTLRYITFAIGNDTESKIKSIFNTSISIHAILSIIILILAETVGLWFFYNKLNIPEGREFAAFVIYQISIASTLLVILTLPYNALVIAYEKMSIFAYFSIIDAILKLGIVYLLLVITFDKLITYGLLMLGTQLIYSIIYFAYCYNKFPVSHINLKIDKIEAKGMIKFAGWSMFGCTAAITYTQGLNLLLNIFGGTAVNAARGLAVQVQSVMTNFANNFQTAVNPQIIKSYAQNKLDEMHTLIYYSAKYSFFLLFILSMPLIINMDFILELWLKNVPRYLSIFLKIILIITMVDSLSNPIMKSADASGKIKKYHVIVGSTLMLILPVSYIFLKNNFPLYFVFIVQLCFSIAALFIRLRIVRNLINLKITFYLKNVIYPIVIVIIPVIILAWAVSNFSIYSKILYFLLSSSLITITTLFMIWEFGMSSTERALISDKIKRFLKKS